ncbi:c-type cytochrome [Candidatus Marithrix sp. Canyon 246]|nr:c-type cytochrome [Candidatus Marithrix sp. Canyon 246]
MKKIFYILLCSYWLNLAAETNEPPISLNFKEVKEDYYIHNDRLSIKLETHINDKSQITEPVDLWVNIQLPTTPKTDLFMTANGFSPTPEPFKKNIILSKDSIDTILEFSNIPAIAAGNYVFSAYYKQSNRAIAEIRLGDHLHGLDTDPRTQNTSCIAPARSAIASKLSETGCVTIADGKLKPVVGVIPYNVNLMFWSDGAFKERWMVLPADKTITINKEGRWVFPIGSILFKHFYLQDQIFETRLLVHHDENGWAGYSYEWDADGKDATLLEDEKQKKINDQTWIYPSREQCLECHTKNAGDVLGLETIQMNRLHHYSSTGHISPQIDTLIHLGIIDGNKYDQVHFPQPQYNMPLEQRARAYLHTNCSYCHRPGGKGPHDFRVTADLSNISYKQSNPQQYHIITVGDPEHSLISLKMQKGEMPPLGSTVVNKEGVELIDEWISSLTDYSTSPTPSCSPLSAVEFEKTKQIYFNKCAYCHGDSREGKIGKSLLPKNIIELGIEKTQSAIFYGKKGAMPAWGETEILSEEQIDLMTCYLQYPVPYPDEE